MTDARKIINNACIRAHQWWDQTYASAVINDLEAAGFRILGPDEVDQVTVEKCRAIADIHEGKPCKAASGWSEGERQFYDAGQIDASLSISAAIRAIKENE